MKQKKWARFGLTGVIVLNLCLFINNVSYAVVKSPSVEQGEEVYDSKDSKNHVADNPTDKVEFKSYGTATYVNPTGEQDPKIGHDSTEAQPAAAGDSKAKLKDFQKRNVSKKSSRSDDSKDKLEESSVPAHDDLEEETETSSKHVTHEKEISEEMGEDKEDKIEANKLVNADEKAVKEKKYTGIFWFIGVFIVLLIVVFAFT